MAVPSKKDEAWRPVVGAKGEYYVSNLGRIKKGGRLIAVSKDRDGYETCCIDRKKVRLHRIVATAWCENDDPKHKDVVDHKNNIKDDNRAENLQWTTRQNNTQMAYDDNLISKGRANVLAIDADNNMILYNTQKEAADATGTDTKMVNKVIHGFFSQTKGWRFFRCRSFTDKRGSNE